LQSPDSLIAAKVGAAAGGAEIADGLGGRKGFSSGLSALCFAAGGGSGGQGEADSLL